MSRRKMILAAAVTLTLCMTAGAGVHASENESAAGKMNNVGSEIQKISMTPLPTFPFIRPTDVPSYIDHVYTNKPTISVEPTTSPTDETIDTPESTTPPTTNPGGESGDETSAIDVIAMYRLYNPNSGEHFYTASLTEKNHLANIGWRYEGIGWYAPDKGHGIPVYRLYNKNGGEHHYTVSLYERRTLLKAGWRNEGIGWYSYEAYNQGSDDTRHSKAKRIPKTNAIPLYRQYNPNAFANNHNYTSSIKENNYLISLGWRGEGIGWYGVNLDPSKQKQTSDPSMPDKTQSRRIKSYNDFERMEANDEYKQYFGTPDKDDETETAYFSDDEWNATIYQYNDVSLVDTGLKGTAYLDVVEDYGGHELKWEYTNADEDAFNKILTSAQNSGYEITQRSISYGISEYAQIYTQDSFLSVIYNFDDKTIEIHAEGD